MIGNSLFMVKALYFWSNWNLIYVYFRPRYWTTFRQMDQMNLLAWNSFFLVKLMSKNSFLKTYVFKLIIKIFFKMRTACTCRITLKLWKPSFPWLKQCLLYNIVPQLRTIKQDSIHRPRTPGGPFFYTLARVVFDAAVPRSPLAGRLLLASLSVFVKQSLAFIIGLI